MTTYRPGTYIFSMSAGPDAIDQARAYCKRNGLTMDDAVLREEGDSVVVILKREWTHKEHVPIA